MKNPAKFLKPEPEPDIEAGYPAGSGFSRISGRFLSGSIQGFLYIYILARISRNCGFWDEFKIELVHMFNIDIPDNLN